jgi:hypothetical protein
MKENLNQQSSPATCKCTMSRMNEMPVADGNLKDEADTRLLELTIISG